ncbi:unnamed protein product, partial [Ectocarpus sp. 12 AP-2014]
MRYRSGFRVPRLGGATVGVDKIFADRIGRAPTVGRVNRPGKYSPAVRCFCRVVNRLCFPMLFTSDIGAADIPIESRFIGEIWLHLPSKSVRNRGAVGPGINFNTC